MCDVKNDRTSNIGFPLCTDSDQVDSVRLEPTTQHTLVDSGRSSLLSSEEQRDGLLFSDKFALPISGNSLAPQKISRWFLIRIGLNVIQMPLSVPYEHGALNFGAMSPTLHATFYIRTKLSVHFILAIIVYVVMIWRHSVNCRITVFF